MLASFQVLNFLLAMAILCTLDFISTFWVINYSLYVFIAGSSILSYWSMYLCQYLAIFVCVTKAWLHNLKLVIVIIPELLILLSYCFVCFRSSVFYMTFNFFFIFMRNIIEILLCWICKLYLITLPFSQNLCSWTICLGKGAFYLTV